MKENVGKEIETHLVQDLEHKLIRKNNSKITINANVPNVSHKYKKKLDYIFLKLTKNEKIS